MEGLLRQAFLVVARHSAEGVCHAGDRIFNSAPVWLLDVVQPRLRQVHSRGWLAVVVAVALLRQCMD